MQTGVRELNSHWGHQLDVPYIPSWGIVWCLVFWSAYPNDTFCTERKRRLPSTGFYPSFNLAHPHLLEVAPPPLLFFLPLSDVVGLRRSGFPLKCPPTFVFPLFPAFLAFPAHEPAHCLFVSFNFFFDLFRSGLRRRLMWRQGRRSQTDSQSEMSVTVIIGYCDRDFVTNRLL